MHFLNKLPGDNRHWQPQGPQGSLWRSFFALETLAQLLPNSRYFVPARLCQGLGRSHGHPISNLLSVGGFEARDVKWQSGGPKKELNPLEGRVAQSQANADGVDPVLRVNTILFSGTICYIRLVQGEGHGGRRPPSATPSPRLPPSLLICSLTAPFNRQEESFAFLIPVFISPFLSSSPWMHRFFLFLSLSPLPLFLRLRSHETGL